MTVEPFSIERKLPQSIHASARARTDIESSFPLMNSMYKQEKKNLSMSNALKNFLHQMSLNAKQK